MSGNNEYLFDGVKIFLHKEELKFQKYTKLVE